MQLPLNLFELHIDSRTVEVDDDREPWSQVGEGHSEHLAGNAFEPVALHGTAHLACHSDSEPGGKLRVLARLNEHMCHSPSDRHAVSVGAQEIAPFENPVL